MISYFGRNGDCLIRPLLKKWIGWTIVSFIFVISLGCGERAKPTISVCGATTANPIMKMASAKYMQENDVFLNLRSVGSKVGIQALIEGTCDIATSSSQITQAQKEEAELKGIIIKEFIFAYDIIVPVIHPTNPVRDLRMDQLREIFTGSIKSWSEVGGTSDEILVVHRDINSGTREVWERIVINSGSVPRSHVFLHSNSEVLAYVAKHPAAIGYISFGYINNEIKTISINGIKPTLEEAGSWKYPIHRNLYLYVDKKKLSYKVKTFIIYLLSSEGQEIVKESGFIPLYPLSLER
jgi:phosphate transport system substrate-binding protein